MALFNNLDLSRFDTTWSQEDFLLGPHHKEYNQRLRELVKVIINNEPYLHPYSAEEVTTILAYEYGLRTVSIPVVANFMQESFPPADERKTLYLQTLQNKATEEEVRLLQETEVTDEERQGFKPAHYEKMVMWDNARGILNFIHHRLGVKEFTLKTLRDLHFGGDKSAKETALNLLKRERFVTKNKQGFYKLTNLGRQFINEEPVIEETAGEYQEVAV